MPFELPTAVHPVFVHFAVALTLFGLATDTAAHLLRRDAWHRTGLLNVTWGSASMLLAASMGWLDHERLHDVANHTHTGGELMQIHQYLGWGLSVAFVGLAVWRRTLHSGVTRKFLVVASMLALALVAQGHIGGELVYRHGVGVRSHEAGDASIRPEQHEPVHQLEESPRLEQSDESRHDHGSHEH